MTSLAYIILENGIYPDFQGSVQSETHSPLTVQHDHNRIASVWLWMVFMQYRRNNAAKVITLLTHMQ